MLPWQRVLYWLNLVEETSLLKSKPQEYTLTFHARNVSSVNAIYILIWDKLITDCKKAMYRGGEFKIGQVNISADRKLPSIYISFHSKGPRAVIL